MRSFGFIAFLVLSTPAWAQVDGPSQGSSSVPGAGAAAGGGQPTGPSAGGVSGTTEPKGTNGAQAQAPSGTGDDSKKKSRKKKPATK